VESKYDEEKDFGLFSDPPENWVTVTPGKFAIFFPEDAHAPLISDGIIRKAVIKIVMDPGY
jgi:YhcH/YjgK/YiaL family protein